jgi:hypothetical protein
MDYWKKQNLKSWATAIGIALLLLLFVFGIMALATVGI